jgi:hypothetical protein
MGTRLARALWFVAAGLSLAACGGGDESTTPVTESTASPGVPTTTPKATASSEAPSPETTASSDAPITSPETTASPTTPATVGDGGRCLVRLHGKGGGGADTFDDGDVSVIAPAGNAEGWGGRQWLYFPEEEYEAARSIVASAVGPCEQIIVNGFSNGAAFAAKMFCRGETFEGRLRAVVVDDPVVDHGVEGCAPAPGVAVTLYWTGALQSTAQPGWDCAEGDWTCEGGSTIGIDAYAEALGTDVVDSPFDDHQWYTDAPELSEW